MSRDQNIQSEEDLVENAKLLEVWRTLFVH